MSTKTKKWKHKAFKNQQKIDKGRMGRIEVFSVNKDQLNILEMMRDGYHNPQINYNPTFSLWSFMKIDEKEKMKKTKKMKTFMICIFRQIFQ